MIRNNQELEAARERISYLLSLLARLRVSSRPEELRLVSGGYRAEVECMQREVLDYLTQPVAARSLIDQFRTDGAKAGQPRATPWVRVVNRLLHPNGVRPNSRGSLPAAPLRGANRAGDRVPRALP